MRKRLLLSTALLATTGIVLANASSAPPTGRIGPASATLVNGRHLHPVGAQVAVGNFPTGGALTPDGRFYWAVSTGRGKHDVRIVSVASHRVIQVVAIPGASGGIVMDPRLARVYISGVADSSHTDQQRVGLPGRGGDVIHVFAYDRATGRATWSRLYNVPPPSGSPIPQGIAYIPGLEGPPQEFPPTNQTRVGWPDRLAISPDGSRLLVPLNLADHAAIVDVATGTTRYVAVGKYPYGAAILRDGVTGLVSNEADGTVSVLNLVSGVKTTDIQVGPALSHPEAIVADPHADRAFVTITNSDQVAVLDTKSLTVTTVLSADHGSGLGSAPVALALANSGRRLLVAEEGTDDLSVFSVPAGTGSYALVGRIPTAEFPADVAVHGATLVYLSAKGLGVGPNLNGPNPVDKRNNDNQINAFSYLPSIVDGSVGLTTVPSDAALRHLTATADNQIVPSNAQRPPVGTPLRAGGPISHVFYIVKENRTYDQVLGDVGRGDSDPKLTLFGKPVTPNLHALVTRFPLLDHVYANSEASIDGHFWAAAGGVSDYVHKNWFQNYGGRGRPYDFGAYAVSWPGNGFLFDQAQRDGITYFNYGEAVAGVVPLPDKDRTPATVLAETEKFAHSDLGLGTRVGLAGTAAGQCYPNDIDIESNAITTQQTYDSSPPAGAPASAESRFDCFKTRFDQQVATGTVPAFNYLVLPNDHTVGTSPGKRTPAALIADNDYGLGQIVDHISHSSVWGSSAIFVIEDDSQDGADHVDAHRIPAAVISPYAVRGAVINTRYDFLSVIRSMELILGMHPLGLFDGLATPMYQAFASTPVNLAPYTAIVPPQSRSALNTAASPGAAASAAINWSRPDQVGQLTLDTILWRFVHGADSTPPPPGPGATAD